MAGGSLTSQPLNPHSGLLWQFLVELLVCGVLAVFFLFYFNRLFATILSYGIRAYTWHKFRAYIDIQSLQISLLGGRIFWKGIRYHGHNQTILVHGGYITWRYWFRKVKETELFEHGKPTPKGRLSQTSTAGSTSTPRTRSTSVGREENGGGKKSKEQPCRISIKVSGVEVFLYNRSPAYDSIVENFARFRESEYLKKRSGDRRASDDAGDKAGLPGDQPVHTEKMPKSSHGTNVDSGEDSEERSSSSTGEKPSTFDGHDSSHRAPEIPSFLQLFPIRIDCNKGAAVVGNECTPTVITAKFDRASGEFSAAHAGPLDLYKQLFSFDFEHPVVHMKENPDYKSPQLATAARLKKEAEVDPDAPKPQSKRWAFFRPRLWHPLQNLSARFSKSTDSLADSRKATMARTSNVQPPFPGQERWQGLTRYLDDDQHDEHDEWGGVEYAKFSLIADVPRVTMTFYWDIPGPVPKAHDLGDRKASVATLDINGSDPPDYGLDLHVHGGTINYGPWADRHRAILQNYFFPTSYTDAVPAENLHPGKDRVNTVFKLFMTLDDSVVLRIPLREPSKDWRWKGKAQSTAGSVKKGQNETRNRGKGMKRPGWTKKRDTGANGPNMRPFGWLDIKVMPDSTISYVMDMVARPQGYRNSLDVDVRGLEIFSSVNHGLLWRSGSLGMKCDLSNPLQWNGLREWTFNVQNKDLELFLLRDHMFLIIDLVGDWGSGPPSDYYTFTPYKYIMNMEFHDLKFFLNTNDSNIINNPSEMDDNHFIILYGEKLTAALDIPLEHFRPLQNQISFSAFGEKLGLDMSMPPSDTLNAFVKEKNVARLASVKLDGDHRFFSETRAGLTDRLTLDIHGDQLVLTLYGFLVRHFMKVKENYFGEDLHFKTLEEYQELPQSKDGEQDGVPLAAQNSNKSNDLDVILGIGACDATVLLPANLYASEDNVRVDLPFAAADLRFTNYYMDLMVDFSPLSISLNLSDSNAEPGVDHSSETQLFIESVNIFGHRLFGLPPTEPTYVCNWDFDIGKISGECSATLVDKIAAFGSAFAFSLDDDENALPIAHPVVIHDITFLKLRTDTVRIWLHVGKEALLLSTEQVSLDFNDWAGSTFSQRLNVLIPNFTIACVDSKSASRHRTRAGSRNPVETHAYLQTDVRVQMLKRKLDFSADRQKQQEHIRESDMRTGRTPFLLLNGLANSSNLLSRPPNLDPPALAYPPMPYPIGQRPSTGNYSALSNSLPDSSSMTSSAASLYPTAPNARLRSGRRGQGGARSIKSMSSVSVANSIRDSAEPRPVMRSNASGRSTPALRPTLFDRTSTTVYSGTATPEEERERRGLAPSSIALTSSLATPYFPLNTTEFDLSDVPELTAQHGSRKDSSGATPMFNDISTKEFDENFVHTSLLISADPGIRAVCSPKAVVSVVNILDALQPKQPVDILDSFQIDIMSQILNLQKRIEGKGTSLELSVRVPSFHLRFINAIQAADGRRGNVCKDQYDMVMDQLAVSLRSKQYPASANQVNTLAVHTTLQSINLSVRERRPEGTENDVAIQAVLDDMLLWLVTGQSASVNLSFRTLEIANSSKKIQYLASLIHRTTMLIDELQMRFAGLGSQGKRRLQYLAYSLTVSGESISDPAFITRPSYALRAATNHLRNHDSWKIISRLRHVYNAMSEAERENLIENCTRAFPSCPADAEATVIQSWDQWRTWDLAHVKKSLAMRALWGSMAVMDDPHGEVPKIPVEITVRTSAVKLVVDPGPEQSEVMLQLLAIDTTLSPAPLPTGLMLLGNESTTRATIVQVNTRNIAVRLNWEICKLVENSLRLFQNEAPSGHQQQGAKCETAITKGVVPEIHDFQVVFSTESSITTLETINLKTISKTQGLKISVAGADRTDAEEGLSVSVLAHADKAGTDLRSRGRLLWRSQVITPNIFVSHEDQEWRDPMPEQWTITGKCDEVSHKIFEDIPGMIEVANSIIIDEAAYFYSKRDIFNPPKQPSESAKGQAEEKRLPSITIALLMDSYLIDVALVQSLTYTISGKMGRLSVTPVLGHGMNVNVNFDLDRHNHYLRSQSQNESHIITTLNMPPHNGRLRVNHSDAGTRIVFNSILEAFVLEASAIHGLLTTLNEPEVTSVLQSIKDDIEVLKSNINETLPNLSRPEASEDGNESSPVAFDASFVMTGLSILASAPGKLPDSPTANLAFELNRIQAKASNMTDKEGVLLSLPEFSALLPQINLALELAEGKTTRPCGNLAFNAEFRGTVQDDSPSIPKRDYRVRSSGLEVNIFADTASAVVEVMNHLQEKIKDIDLTREKRYLRRLRRPRRSSRLALEQEATDEENTESIASSGLFTSAASVELLDIQVSWIVGSSVRSYPDRETEDLVLSFKRIDLSTRSEEAARLMIENMQLQMAPTSQDKRERSMNSALLPEVVFNVTYASTKTDRRLAFHAAGKSLDLRLESGFVLPADVLERSIALAVKKFQAATASWRSVPSSDGKQRKSPFGNKKLSSLVVDADFAGAVVQLQGRRDASRPQAKIGTVGAPRRVPHHGRYGQFASNGSVTSTTLRAPGVTVKVEYRDDTLDPSLNAELKVDASTNMLYPTVVPLIMDISKSIKEMVREKDEPDKSAPQPDSRAVQKLRDEDNLITADPSAILGKTRLNLGIRICKQEFSLSCQPIARVAATARFDDIYLTMNSVKSTEQGNFFAVSAIFDNLQASVQHVYSRESTFSFDVDSVVLSLMNSKHLSGTSGMSAILKINPMKTHINARQLQDFLLFREIWIPPEIRQPSKPAEPAPNTPPQEYLVQRYQQVAAAAAFPWNATVAVSEVSIDLDLGQAIGKPSLKINNLWASSKKSSSWEQNLCVGVEKIGIESTGRTAGFVELSDFQIRTSIRWPSQEIAQHRRTPLIQASLGFERLIIKAAFDYAAFGVADITSFAFLMYNVRGEEEDSRDRLVATLEGDRVQTFMTSTSAAQVLAVIQAVERLVQENQAAYQQSLKDIEKFLRRGSVTVPSRMGPEPVSSTQATSSINPAGDITKTELETPISLHTDVVVTLRSISVGCFPTAFSDHQVLLLNANDVQARFAVALESARIHSGLGMTLGQLSVALASVAHPKGPKTLDELTVEQVVHSATTARGGTILRVPKVLAAMQTWQAPKSNHIDYIFKSTFEGKVDVGWNYSRISFIRNMWNTHSKALATRLGKPLAESAVRINAEDPSAAGADAESASATSKPETSSPSSPDAAATTAQTTTTDDRGKITAVVNVPTSGYEYTPLEPPVIETPQLRDMGEATPPLEWIGLHRDRLPNVTHQIVIVSLLEIVKEVEDAYGKILGSS